MRVREGRSSEEGQSSEEGLLETWQLKKSGRAMKTIRTYGLGFLYSLRFYDRGESTLRPFEPRRP